MEPVYDIIESLRELSHFLDTMQITVKMLNKTADDAEDFMHGVDGIMAGIDDKVENMKLKAEV